MRRIREITAEEERFRTEPFAETARGVMVMTKRDPVQAEPIGTLLLVPMRVVGFDQDCDGSLMARFEFVALDELDGATEPEILAAPDAIDAQRYGVVTHRGLYPNTGLVATSDEIRALIPSEGPREQP